MPPLNTALLIEDLVDEHTGVIRRVRDVLTPPRAPSAYTSMTAEVANARWLGDWPADRVSLGTTWNDPHSAFVAAVAEGAERYCGNFLPAELPHNDFQIGTRRELLGTTIPAIEVDQLPTWAPWQLAAPNFAYTPLTDTTPALWTQCTELDSGEENWLPASLVYLNWRQDRFRYLPRVHHLNYAGIAAGQGLDDAVDRAILELVERDALELWWHLGGPARGIDPKTVPGLTDLMSDCDLEFWLVEMPSEFAPCVAALVYDPTTGVYAAGFACRTDPADAARKALLEAVHTWIYTLGATDEDGWVFQSVDAGLLASGLLLPYRRDRRYLNEAGHQMENVRDLGAHVQVWLDPNVHHLAKRWAEPDLGMVGIDELRTTTPTQIRAQFRAEGHRLYVRDLTTSDIAETPLRVARVVAPSLVPNAPAAFTYFGHSRFRDAAHHRGWRKTAPTEPSDFTLIPPPHM